MSLRVTWFKSVYTPQKLGEMLLAEIERADNFFTFSNIYTANENLAKDLIAAGADLTVRNKQGDTPFLAAIGKRRMGVANAILATGNTFVVNDRNNGQWSYTALHVLIEAKDEKTLRRLLTLGLDAAATDSRHNHNGLFWAARLGVPQIMSLLLDECPHLDINARDVDGKTPLILAISKISPFTALHLLDQKNIDLTAVDKYNMTAAKWADQLGMKLVIQRIADIEAKQKAQAQLNAEQKKKNQDYFKAGMPMETPLPVKKVQLKKKPKQGGPHG